VLFRSSSKVMASAYHRSADAMTFDDPGQDFLIINEKPNTILFALCDGVSQSFFGDLAARILGNALIDWLDQAPHFPEPGELCQSLSTFLSNLAPSAGDQVKSYPLPGGTPPMLRAVLEEKRNLGSETTFICARIDLPTPALPGGHFLAAWMGDSRLRLFGPEGEGWRQLARTFSASQRWSTRRGLVGGEPNILMSRLLDSTGTGFILERCLVYSDGFKELDGTGSSLSNNELQDLIDRAAHSPQSDDISLFEIWLRGLPQQIVRTADPFSAATLEMAPGTVADADVSGGATEPFEALSQPEVRSGDTTQPAEFSDQTKPSWWKIWRKNE
jgi:hypothetical protein